MRSACARCPNGPSTRTTPAATPCRPTTPTRVNLLLDQGHETMEGASGDDWISVAQSMRAYLRFSMLGGIIGEQIRRLGYSARVHSVLDGDVLQPPLLLLSGLGEVSRIGEVILNPYLGPRLKSGTVTTDLPMACRQADRLRPAALLRKLQQVRARMPVGRDHRRSQADVQRLRDLEERRREMRALPHHQCRRRHVRALHEDLSVEPGRPVRRERFPLAGDEPARQRTCAGRARRQAGPRHDQPGQEVVVGHRTRPQQRRLCAGRPDATSAACRRTWSSNTRSRRWRCIPPTGCRRRTR